MEIIVAAIALLALAAFIVSRVRKADTEDGGTVPGGSVRPDFPDKRPV